MPSVRNTIGFSRADGGSEIVKGDSSFWWWWYDTDGRGYRGKMADTMCHTNSGSQFGGDLSSDPDKNKTESLARR